MITQIQVDSYAGTSRKHTLKHAVVDSKLGAKIVSHAPTACIGATD